MDYTVCGILQARILEWVAFPFSRGSSQLRDQTHFSHIAGGFFTSWATRGAQARCTPKTLNPLGQKNSEKSLCLQVSMWWSYHQQPLSWESPSYLWQNPQHSGVDRGWRFVSNVKAKQEELVRHQPWAVFSGILHSNPGFLGGSDGKEYTCIWETWVLFLDWEDPLEEGMTIHSSILAGASPRTEEPGELQSMESPKVGHDWTIKRLSD